MNVLKKVQAIREAMDKAGAMVTSSQAASLVYLFKSWSALSEDGVSAMHYNAGDRRRFNDAVYECRSEHDAQAHYTPDMIPALWKRLDVDHTGTIDDPIPYETGMEIFNGKYYTENDVLYLCNRDSGQPLYHDLSALIGIYVTTV